MPADRTVGAMGHGCASLRCERGISGRSGEERNALVGTEQCVRTRPPVDEPDGHLACTADDLVR